MQKAGATGDDQGQLLTITCWPRCSGQGSTVTVWSRATRLSRCAYGQVWGQKEARPRPGQTGPTHTECFTISEWILATPLTAWEPITHRWAILMRLQSPSSIIDILRRRSTSPGNRAATCCCQETEA